MLKDQEVIFSSLLRRQLDNKKTIRMLSSIYLAEGWLVSDVYLGQLQSDKQGADLFLALFRLPQLLNGIV